MPIIESASSLEDLEQKLAASPESSAIIDNDNIAVLIILATRPSILTEAKTECESLNQERKLKPDGGNGVFYASAIQFKGRFAIVSKFSYDKDPDNKDENGWIVAIAPMGYTIDQCHKFFLGFMSSIKVVGAKTVTHSSSRN